MKKSAKTLFALIFSLVCLLVFAFIFINNKEIFISDNSIINSDSNDDFVKIIDVGQGDSILICSNGYSLLVDTGIPDNANDLCNNLSEQNIDTLDVLLLTHLDNDHSGGVNRVTEVFKPKNLILPEVSIESEGLSTAYLAIDRVTKSGGEIFTAVQGMNFKIGDFNITILAQFTNLQSENNRSVIVMAEKDGKKFLLTGDLETKGEKALLKEGLNLKCDVLKVGHHGSISSTSEDFLKAIRPRYAAISVGVDNRYGHPSNKVLSALDYIGAKVYRTDLDGDITFYVNDGKITVDTLK